MKVLILANNALGLVLFRKKLIFELLKKNEVTISAPYEDVIQELVDLGCKLSDTSVDRRGMNPVKDLKLFFTYRTLLCREKPELVITYTIKPNTYGGIACRLAKVPYAVNITGLGTGFQGSGPVKKLVCVLYKIALKRAKIVFFENSENRDILVGLGLVKPEQTKVLNGAGVDLEKFSFVEYPPETGETKFLFIGRIMREKGVDQLMDAMRRLQSEGVNCSLDMLGGFDENYANLLKTCEAEGRLRYHGVQSDVRPFIADCHCFVLPSWHEGMANTNLESAASGRPVITSNIHGCLEAVIDGESGFLCEAKNADSLYETMKRFVSLPYEQKAAMGARGREHMEAVFDKRRVVEETLRGLGCKEAP